MAIIVLLTLVGTLPAIFSLRITQRKCSRCTPRANYARHPARSSTTKATLLYVCVHFHPGIIRFSCAERQAHSLHYCSLRHNTEKTLLMNAKRHGDCSEVRNSFAQLQIEIACKFVQAIPEASLCLTGWESNTLLCRGFCTCALAGDDGRIMAFTEPSVYNAQMLHYDCSFMAALALINSSGLAAKSVAP